MTEDRSKAYLVEAELGAPFLGAPLSPLDGSSFVNGRLCSNRELVRQWALAKGLSAKWVENAKDYQLTSVYSKREYFQKIKSLSDDEIYTGRRGARRRNEAIADGVSLEEIMGGSDRSDRSGLDAEATSPPPTRQSPDLFSDGSTSLPSVKAQRSPDAPIVLNERQLAALASAAEAAIRLQVNTLLPAAARDAARAEMERVGLSDRVKQQIRDLAAESARDVLAAHLPTRVEIVAPSVPNGLDLGLQHERFPHLLKLIGARGRGGFRLNIWLTGPTGSGKTTAVEKATEALAATGAFSRYARDASGSWYITNALNADQSEDLNGLIYDSPFGGDSSLDADYKVIGYDKADGTFRWTTFLRIFCFGGVYIADEIDNWSPSALVALNAPLANGWVATPAGIMRRHPDSCIIAAANTWGLGATSDYVGRSKLDAATTNRFPNKMDWPYDEKLEMALAEADGGALGRSWATIVQRARAEAKKQGLQVIFSPRNTYDGIAALRAGFDVREVVAMNLTAGLDPEYVKVLGLDRIAQLPGLEAPAAAKSNGHDNGVDPLTQAAYDRFYRELTQGNKAAATLMFREFHGPDRVGLATAKTWVEDFEAGLIEVSAKSFAQAAGLALWGASP